VSGRAWKQPGQRAGTLRNPKLSSSWEKKMQQKAVDKAYKEVKQAAVQAKKEAKQVRRHWSGCRRRALERAAARPPFMAWASSRVPGYT
jgi:hypothetical protein